MNITEVELPEEISPDWVSREHARLLQASRTGDLRLNCGGLKKLDSLSLAWLASLQSSATESAHSLVLVKMPEALKVELAKVTRPEPDTQPVKPSEPLALRTGHSAIMLYQEVRVVLVLLTESLYLSTFAMFKKKTLSRGETVIQMVRLGSTSLPIVLLLSTLIGFTLALQSGVQLQKFGATIFLASGIGISMVTEIGPIMTAVILAGRSGSSITAEIATMVVQEEVGALQSMAINPLHYLVLPRFWAMSLMVPLLTICSAVSGVLAGMAVGFLFFRLSPVAFISELKDAVTLNYLGQMLIKSLTFGWVIALVSIHKGLNVRGGADAVGKATTSCVVICIFSIILADAMFSFLFYY